MRFPLRAACALLLALATHAAIAQQARPSLAPQTSSPHSTAGWSSTNARTRDRRSAWCHYLHHWQHRWRLIGEACSPSSAFWMTSTRTLLVHCDQR